MEKKFITRILLIIVMPILCMGVMIQPKKISKKRFEKLKKSQRKWIKYRDKKAWEAYDKEQGGSIAGVSYRESIIKNTKKRTKWIMDTYL